MKNLNVQDWCAIIAAVIAVGGVIVAIIRLIYKKIKVKPANIRANFFKIRKSWCLRIYNASNTEIEAVNIKVDFPVEDGFITNWNCKKDLYPSLKQHASFDIHVVLCTSAPDCMPITISWKQGKKTFSSTDYIQLR